MSVSVGKFERIALAMSMGAVTVALHAQPIPDEELTRRQAQQREAIEERAGQAPDVFTPSSADVPAALLLPEETPCFRIARVDWRDAEPFPWLREADREIVGQCVGALGLQAFQKYLLRQLLERGYVTSRVLIPEQNLAGGSLTVQLLPGRIGRIRAEGDSPGLTRLAFAAGEGDVLNQRDLDQSLENMRRLATQQGVEFDLVPGAELGETDIVVRHPEGRRWRGLLTLDDSGADETGKYQMGAVMVFDSPFQLYDVLTLTLNNNLNYGNSRLGTNASSISWNVPYGYWSFFLAANQSNYKQTVAGFGGDIEYSGRSHGVEAGIGYVPYRTSASKGLLQFKLGRKASRSYIDDTEIDVQYRNVVGYDLSATHRQYMDRASLELTLGLRGSLPHYSSAPGLIVGEPTWDGRYRIKTASASLSAPFDIGGQPFRYNGSVRVQKAGTMVPASEHFMIGNRYTVRGFDGASTLAAEEGWLLRNEIAWPLPGQSHELFLALDRGGVDGPQAALLLGRGLTGAAIGLRGAIKQLSYEITIGRPVRKPDGFETKKTAVAVSLTAAF